MKTSARIILVWLSTMGLVATACTSAPTSLPTSLPTFALKQVTAIPTNQPNTVYLPFTLPGKSGERAAAAEPVNLPQVMIQVSEQVLRVNDSLTITGMVQGIGVPYYYLHVLDEGQQNAPPLVMVTSTNELHPQEGNSQILELVSANGEETMATFVLRAKAPGIAGVSIQVTGEIQDASGAQVMSGAGSEPVQIIVNP